MRARDNPFRSERLLQIRYRLRDTTWPQLLARLERLRFRAALVGPHGSGKTTLLEDLKERLRERGFGTLWIRLDDEHRSFESRFLDGFFRGVTSNKIILFDGAEQMSPLVWWRFQRRSHRAGGLIITTHRPGRLPTLLECRTTAELLAGIASELLGENLERVQSKAEMLYQKYRGNLRDALREWYDHGAYEIH
jgi:energy-coupling factor transporter ATP-binding protein EcfA2